MRFHWILLFLIAQVLTISSGVALADVDISEAHHFRRPVFGAKGRIVIFEERKANIPADQFGTVWWKHDFVTGHRSEISLDQQKILAAIPDRNSFNVAVVSVAGRGQFNIWITDIRSGNKKQVTTLDTFPVHLTWSPDGSKLAFLANDAPPSYFPELGKNLPPSVRALVTDRLAFHSDRGGYSTGFNIQLHWIDLNTNSVSQLTSAKSLSPQAGISWSNDSTGLYYAANNGPDWEFELHELNLYRVTLHDNNVAEITSTSGRESHGRESPDGRWLAFLSRGENGTSYQLPALKFIDRNSGQVSKTVLSLDRQIVSFRWQSNSRSLYILYDDRGRRVLAEYKMNGTVREITREISAAGFGQPYASGSFDISPNDELVYSYAPNGLASQIVKSDREGLFATIASVTAGPSTKSPSLPQEFWFPSSNDKIELQGWLYAPNDNHTCERCPLIVILHGGTHGFYGPFFSPEIQHYTSRGYYVATINQRGSGSYGKVFANLSHHLFPAVGEEDILDGITYLQEAFPIDPNRLYVTGGSAGGTFGAWLLGKTERFAGAAIAKPAVNLASSYLASDIADYKFATNWFPEMPWQRPEYFWAHSPLSNVEKIKTPTLVLVGIEDLRTPPTEAIQLFRALKFTGTPTAIALFPRVAHSFSVRPSSLQQKMTLTTSWFDELDAKKRAQ